MLHFCCADNIVAMVLQYLPKFSSTSPEALLLWRNFLSHLFVRHNYLWRNPYRKKEKAEKSIFIYGTT
jgi:hypothetical protein